MSNSISIEQQMEAILQGVKEGADEAIEEGLKKAPKRAASKLRSTSPKNQGDYSKGWRVKKIDSKEAVVYNATSPGLTHLLENGHMIRNQYGEYGRYNGIKHIKPVEEEYSEQFLEIASEAFDEITDH